MSQERLNELSKEVFEVSLHVHRKMGPGLLESVYQECLLKEFNLRNVNAEKMATIPLVYKGITLKLKNRFKRFVNNF